MPDADLDADRREPPRTSSASTATGCDPFARPEQRSHSSTASASVAETAGGLVAGTAATAVLVTSLGVLSASVRIQRSSHSASRFVR
jgi:hypothetical protein